MGINIRVNFLGHHKALEERQAADLSLSNPDIHSIWMQQKKKTLSSKESRLDIRMFSIFTSVSYD